MVAEAVEDKLHVDRATIDSATAEVLGGICDQMLGTVTDSDDTFSDQSKLIFNEVLEQIERDEVTGRLVVPALWKDDVQHLLSPNYKLAHSILKSNTSRLSKPKLLEYDKVIREQIDEGVVERSKRWYFQSLVR